LRYVLAATLSPSYGVYSGYELFENEPASDTNEEYLHSEKYEFKHRDYESPDTLAPLMATVNRIRRYHPAFSRLRSVRIWPTSNPQIFAFSKFSDDRADRVLTVVNLDPYNPQEALIYLDLGYLGLPPYGSYMVYDELGGETYTWSGSDPYVRLDPSQRVAHIFSLNLSSE
jgi:starch synthase (maltosyl-transferring)